MAKITKTSIGVQMVAPKNKKPTRIYNYEIQAFTRLGKEIKISPKANVTINKPGLKTEFFVETISVTIGIGKDHSADLLMSKDAWDALLSGQKVSVTTTEDFKKKYILSRKV